MKKINVLLVCLVVLLVSSCEQYSVKKLTDASGYKYETVTNDPLKTRIYTLSNGLKVYLTQNPDEPRIMTMISVRAGSTSDPKETTGLAHYFEHMMFKGCNAFGTTNWEKEKPLLQQLSDMFEKYRSTADSLKRIFIYHEIDSLSQVASTYAIPNEYDKMLSNIGARYTNAFTSEEFTSFINDIPASDFQKWIQLEYVRFGEIALRLFHTELETIYEEFNMEQDRDDSRTYHTLMKGLFPNNPLGRAVIGFPDHIKNPSMVNILKFKEKYYVPNNMAIILSGDLDFEKTIKSIDETFGKMKSKVVPERAKIIEEPITKPVIKEVCGPDAESITIGFRFNGYKSEDKNYVTLINQILNNGMAGLIDLDLVQNQKVLKAYSWDEFMTDYGMQVFNAIPRAGQKLEEAKDLLLSEIEKIKKGEFDDWLIEAAIKDMKLNEIRSFENNWRVFSFLDVFTHDETWANHLKSSEQMSKITKKELVDFANKNYKKNYVIVYKRTGEAKDIVHVKKPVITPIQINRNDQSEYFTKWIKIPEDTIKPIFIDFNKALSTREIKPGVNFSYIKNNTNDIFEINYIVDMGKRNNIKLPIAVNYLQFIGTDKYSPNQLQREFYKAGIRFGVWAGNDRCYVYMSGLNESYNKAVELLEHFLSSSKGDSVTYNKYVSNILKERNDNKKNNDFILWNALFSYGKYGKRSAFTDIISEKDLKSLNPEELTNIVKDISSYKHSIFYYGKNEMNEAINVIEKYHKTRETLKKYPKPAVYPELNMNENKVFLVDYDMSQANIIMLTKDTLFDPKVYIESNIFNEYYGNSMSAVFFQEIRESKALAYSAWAYYSNPEFSYQSFYTFAFLGTQADKLETGINSMNQLLNKMPEDQRLFNLSRQSILKRISTERITKTNIYWTYQSNLQLGIKYDIRKNIFDYMQNVRMDELKSFFDRRIKDKKYVYLIIGPKKFIDMKALQKVGSVKELNLEELFNY